MKALDVRPARAVFVGDRRYDDVFGAQSAGMRAVLVRPGPENDDYDVSPDAEVIALSELVGVVDGWLHPSRRQLITRNWELSGRAGRMGACASSWLPCCCCRFPRWRGLRRWRKKRTPRRPPRRAAVRRGHDQGRGHHLGARGSDVKAGDIVEWVVDGSIVHDLKGDEGVVAQGRSKFTASTRYDKPGTYAYQCTIHAGMNGTVDRRRQLGQCVASRRV